MTPAGSAAAATKPKFAAGSIITDPLFYDFGTMSVKSIQKFLDKRVKKCSSKSEAKCLRDYKTTTQTIRAIPGRCDHDITGSGKKKLSAAQIIYTVARACEVNPQVLLVTLQKEQGLVTAKKVESIKYRKAMGYGCPDSKSCAKEYYGFFNQVYWAARAFNAYYNFPANFRFQPGKTIDIAYSPAKNCGTKDDVYLQNRATAALYNYTPYTPNSSSLAHPYKKGDRCSSYGNRNFWLYFNKWFGNSSLGQYFVKSGSTSYLVAGGSRFTVPTSSPRLLSSLASLGTKAKVSGDYIRSLTSGGWLGPVVQTRTVSGNTTKSSYYLLTGKSRYALTDCAAVQSFGFSCTAPVLPAKILETYTLRNNLLGTPTALVGTSASNRFVLSGGQRHELLNTASATAAGITLSPLVLLDAKTIARIPLGAPIVADGSLALNATTRDGYWLGDDGSVSATIPASMITGADAATWFGGVDGTLSAASLAQLPAPKRVPGIFSSGGVNYLVTGTGRKALTDVTDWAVTVPALDPTIANKITTLTGSLTATALVAVRGSSTAFFIADGKRRTVAAANDTAALATAFAISATPLALPATSVLATPAAGTALPPALVVQTPSGSRWLIDGASNSIRITPDEAKELTGKTTTRTVTSSALSSYPARGGTVPPVITCGSQQYLSINGKLNPLSSADAAQYSAALTFRALDAATCARLAKTGAIGTLLTYNKTHYRIEQGHRVKLTEPEYNAALTAGGIPAKTVSHYLISLFTPATS